MSKTALQQFVADFKGMQLFQQERLMAEITELMCRILNQCGVKRGELAERLGKSKGRVSQILAGETNLTLRTVADVFTVLGKTLTVSSEDIVVERALLQCVGQIVGMPPMAWQTSDWHVEAFAHEPCGNLNMAG